MMWSFRERILIFVYLWINQEEIGHLTPIIFLIFTHLHYYYFDQKLVIFEPDVAPWTLTAQWCLIRNVPLVILSRQFNLLTLHRQDEWLLAIVPDK